MMHGYCCVSAVFSLYGRSLFVAPVVQTCRTDAAQLQDTCQFIWGGLLSTLSTSIGWTNIHAEMPLAPAIPKLKMVGIPPLEDPAVDLVAIVDQSREGHA